MITIPPRTSRVFTPPDMLIYRVPPGSNAGTLTPQTAFIAWIPTPSARILCSIKIIWWQQVTGQAGNNGTLAAPPTNVIDIGNNASNPPMRLFIFAGEKAETGVLTPTQDLVGTLLNQSYQSVPVDYAAPGAPIGLNGFQLDVLGGQKYVCVYALPGLILPYTTRLGINISLRIQYELVQAEMCDDEWEYFKGLMTIANTPPCVFA